MPIDPIVIVSAARTPIGGFQGAFSQMSGASLGAHAIKAAVQRAGISSADVDEVLMGCVLQAGQGQAPARQAALQAGLPFSSQCTTVHKVCGSAMQATIIGHDALLAGSCNVAVVGGMESMSNAPYLLPKARRGYRLGHGNLLDHMFLDGLEDSYSNETRGRLMGTFAEDCATQFKFTRDAQDEFAIQSTIRAKKACEDQSFEWEIEPVSLNEKGEDFYVTRDEGPFTVNIEKIPKLKPAFKKDGTVTPANSSSISDGAAALLLMRASQAEHLGLNPIARIVSHAGHAGKPAEFPTAPIDAIKKLYAKSGWKPESIDLYEINEAFAVVTMAAIQTLKLDPTRVNIHGGACALGHPIGASGARILVTLIGSLRKYKLKRGIAAICIGGGEGLAIGIELI